MSILPARPPNADAASADRCTHPRSERSACLVSAAAASELVFDVTSALAASEAAASLAVGPTMPSSCPPAHDDNGCAVSSRPGNGGRARPVLLQRQPLGLLQHVRTRRPRCAAGLNGPPASWFSIGSIAGGRRWPAAEASSRVGTNAAEVELLKPGARFSVAWRGRLGGGTSRAALREVPRLKARPTACGWRRCLRICSRMARLCGLPSSAWRGCKLFLAAPPRAGRWRTALKIYLALMVALGAVSLSLRRRAPALASERSLSPALRGDKTRGMGTWCMNSARRWLCATRSCAVP